MSSRVREQWQILISGAADVNALRAIRESEQNRLAAAMPSSPVNAIADSLAELHDALMSRALALAEEETARLGFGTPPVPYAYMLFGSGGRTELTFSSDQDSGIVYGNPENEEAHEACVLYFSKLADTVVRFLVEIGYPPCEGNVIASNPDWRLSLAEWERKIDAWFEEPSWENVRYLLILADARPVAGDAELAGRLKDRFFNDMLLSPVISRRMLENTLRHKVLVGVFGQLLRERYGEHAGSLDIKYGAYIPMVNVFRLMAVQAGIRETGTLERIAALRHAGALSLIEAEESSAAFTLLLRLRLLSAAKTEGSQWIGSGKIPADQLTNELTQLLKKALKLGRKMQKKAEREARDRFGGR